MLPEEFYLVGPPVAGELVLRRTIDRVRREATRMARRRLAIFLVALLLALSTLTGLGMAIGERLPRSGPARFVFAASGDGANLAVSVGPGEDGAELGVSLRGLPPGVACQLTVLGPDGTRVVAGSWRTSALGGTLDLSVYLDPASITGVELTAADGVDLLASR